MMQFPLFHNEFSPDTFHFHHSHTFSSLFTSVLSKYWFSPFSFSQASPLQIPIFRGREKEKQTQNVPSVFPSAFEKCLFGKLVDFIFLIPHLALSLANIASWVMMLEKTIMLFQYLIMVWIFLFHSKGPTAGGAVKIPNMPGSDGYWLDPSGIVWRSNPNTKGNHIPDYAPVCTSTTTTTLPADDETRNRYVAVVCAINSIKFI